MGVLVCAASWSGRRPSERPDRLPQASPKSLDLFANQFNICEAEIIIVTSFTGGLMRINSLMSTEVFEDGMCYLRAKRYY